MPLMSTIPSSSADPARRALAQIRKKARFALFLVREAKFADLVGALRMKLWSATTTYGLRRDLTVPFPAPDAAIPITVRAATQADIDTLFDLDDSTVSDAERALRRDRQVMISQGLPLNYVAVTEDNVPCFFQTVLYAADHDTMRTVWGSLFPRLEPHQVIIDAALTPEAFRGLRIMPAAMARISEAAIRPGITEAITFVDLDNIPSLKGCVRSGYHPYCYRHMRWRLGRNTTTFTSIAADTPIRGVTAD